MVDHIGLLLEKDLEPQTQRTDIAQPADEAVTTEVELIAPIEEPALIPTAESEESLAPKKRGRPSAADVSPKFVYTSKVCNCKIVTGIKMLEVYCEHRNRMTLKV